MLSVMQLKSEKKRKWKEEKKLRKQQRQEAKATSDDKPKPSPSATTSSPSKPTSKSKFIPAGIDAETESQPQLKGNREQRRIEQLLNSLGADRSSFEEKVKGKKGKEKIKMLLDETKRRGGKGDVSSGGEKRKAENVNEAGGEKAGKKDADAGGKVKAKTAKKAKAGV